MEIKTIMVHLELGISNQALLGVARDLAKQMNADVIGVAACQPVQVVCGDAYVSGEIFEEDRKEIRKQLDEAESEFREAFQGHARILDWRTDVRYAPLCDYIAEQGRAADIIVTGRGIGGSMFDFTRRVNIAELVMQAGRPVLIVPSNHNRLNLGHVLVAWKASRESRLAVADAIPFLKRAAKVTVARIAKAERFGVEKAAIEDVVAWLSRHGVRAEAKLVPTGENEAIGLAELATQTGTDLIIAGAYGHSRAHEWALGGVTHDFLLSPDRCVLLAH